MEEVEYGEFHTIISEMKDCRPEIFIVAAKMYKIKYLTLYQFSLNKDQHENIRRFDMLIEALECYNKENINDRFNILEQKIDMLMMGPDFPEGKKLFQEAKT